MVEKETKTIQNKSLEKGRKEKIKIMIKDDFRKFKKTFETLK